MLLPRIIPCLLLSGQGLVKGQKFKEHVYIGDPSNAAQIFNTKQADEIIFLDIKATFEKRIPDVRLVQRVTNECLLPFTVGGGLRSVDDMRAMLNAGAEKVCVCSAAVEKPQIIDQGAKLFGSQCVVVAIDVKKNLWGRPEVCIHSGTRATGLSPVQHAVAMEKLGAGELLLNSIDRDGVMQGYDLELVRDIVRAVNVPVIACGGCGSLDDLKKVIAAGASAAAAGSMFVLHGRKRAVLISYPSQRELVDIRGA